MTETLLSNYHGDRCPDGTFNCIQTPFDAIRQMSPNAVFSQGCAINSQDKSGFQSAIAAATNSDVAILFLGKETRFLTLKSPQ